MRDVYTLLILLPKLTLSCFFFFFFLQSNLAIKFWDAGGYGEKITSKGGLEKFYYGLRWTNFRIALYLIRVPVTWKSRLSIYYKKDYLYVFKGVLNLESVSLFSEPEPREI